MYFYIFFVRKYPKMNDIVKEQRKLVLDIKNKVIKDKKYL